MLGSALSSRLCLPLLGFLPLARRPVLCDRTRHYFAPLATQPTAAAATSLGEMPDFRGPSRLLKEARKASLVVAKLGGNPKIANRNRRAAKLASQRVDALASGLSISLREQQKAFRGVLGGLPPFQAALAELTLAALERDGGRSLRDVEADFDGLRRAVVRAGKEATALTSAAVNARVAAELADTGLAAVEAAFEAESGALDELITTAGRLRRLPRPEADEPVLVLVGMPNVGKSSIVTATSTGTPEVNDYPFTTRALKMGHVIGRAARYQVMDTPGVLSRPEEDRNPMEGLTLAAVEHLPSAVVYVMDLSGTCGKQSAPALQLAVREQLRAIYTGRPWLDVCSKADLPLADEVPESAVPEGALRVSVLEGGGVEELRARMAALVGDPGVELS